jgi:VanZ family protein
VRSATASATGRQWVAVLLWAAIQLTLTSLPAKAVPLEVPHPVDWLGHLCMYGGLGFLIARAARLQGWPLRWLVWIGVAIALAAALDELHQLLVPGRDAEVTDWLADTAGSSAGLLVGARLMASRFSTWLS